MNALTSWMTSTGRSECALCPAQIPLGSPAATRRPAFQPGARPPGGGLIESTSSPVRAINQAMIEFEFHISPVRSSSRPQTRIDISGTIRAAAGHRLDRRSVVAGCRLPHRCQESRRRATCAFRSERCEIVQPTGLQLGLRRPRLAPARGRQQPASARSCSDPQARRPEGQSDRDRTPAGGHGIGGTTFRRSRPPCHDAATGTRTIRGSAGSAGPIPPPRRSRIGGLTRASRAAARRGSAPRGSVRSRPG
jgi:hypothetical protein